MKKVILLISTILIICGLFCGCGKDSKIKNLQEQITEQKYKLSDYENERDDLQQYYDYAYSVYSSSKSDNSEIVYEREKLKKQLDELRDKIANLNRNITFSEDYIDRLEDELEELQK